MLLVVEQCYIDSLSDALSYSGTSRKQLVFLLSKDRMSCFTLSYNIVSD